LRVEAAVEQCRFKFQPVFEIQNEKRSNSDVIPKKWMIKNMQAIAQMQ
jgi:hypothetical protein